MSNSEVSLEPSGRPRPFEPLKKRGHPIIAWILILIAVGVFIGLRHVPGGDAPSGDDGVSNAMLELQGKYMVGAYRSLNLNGEDLYQQSKALNTGSLSTRLRFVVLAGELAGAEEARKQLSALEVKVERRVKNQRRRPVQVSTEQTRLLGVLRKLYRDYSNEMWQAPSVSKSDRRLVVQELDWFGQLALAPADGIDKQARKRALAPTLRTLVVVLGAVFCGLAAAAVGLLLLVVFVAMAIGGYVSSALPPPSGNGSLYAETFALWLILYPLLSMGAEMYLAYTAIEGLEYRLMFSLAAFAMSLTALAWPLLRGITLKQMLHEIGWTSRRNVLWEMVCGAAAYLGSLPLLGIGVAMVLVLITLYNGFAVGEGGGDEFSAAQGPSHPIVEWIDQAPLLGRLLVVALACVAAPIIEETMFRGVFYRHLREWTARWRTVVSVLFCAAVNSFIFAVIHPQGFLAVPVLMALATGFTIAREWRGCLIAPMTAHAINNGVAMAVLFSIT